MAFVTKRGETQLGLEWAWMVAVRNGASRVSQSKSIRHVKHVGAEKKGNLCRDLDLQRACNRLIVFKFGSFQFFGDFEMSE